MANTKVSSAVPDPAADLTITRIFRAPPELLWMAWTDSEMFKLWWGPRGFTSPVTKIDLRVGGKYLNCMRSPEGKDFWSTGTYREVVPEKRLVMTDSFADEKGNVVPGSYYGMGPEFPLEMTITVTFRGLDGKTELTLIHSGAGQLNDTDLASMRQGWDESLDKLAEVVERGGNTGGTTLIAEPGKQEIVVIREFDAPRELVFRAFTDPKLYVQWLGPRGLTMHLEIFEPRNGGRWRYVQTDEEGNEFAFHGVNHEVTAPERIIGTFEFEGLPEKGHVLLQTAKFEALPHQRTRMTVQSVFQSLDDRDGMLQSGMEEGVRDSYDRLDKLLARIQGEGEKP
jgi:uncharacterized protein YndB with AHSA1/START domain